MARPKKEQNITVEQHENELAFEIFKSLLLNPKVYDGHADSAYGVVKTAIRLAQVWRDETSVQVADVASKD